MISSNEPLAPMLGKLCARGTLDDADRAAVLALPYKLKAHDADGYIVREGDIATHSCLLRTGFAYRQKIVKTGERQICSIHLPGDMVDLQNSLLVVADHSVQCLTRADTALIPREAVIELAFRRPNIGLAMWYDTLVDAAIFREWTTNIGRRDARTRLAHILCEFAMRMAAAGLGDHTAYDLPMSQQELGDCTGLTPVHVNRMLRSLEEAGLIARKQRSVSILDWDGLVSAGDFDAAYLHLPNA